MATSPVDDIGPRKYDPEFLKSLASPPKPKQAELPVAWRRVVPKTSGVMPASVTTPRATMWQRLSSLFTSEAPSPKVERGSYEVTLDLSKQVLHLDVLRAFGHDLRAVAQEALLFPSFAEASVDPSEFAPAAALALKAKQFDDGLYASVELAADAGLGRFHGKRDFVLALLQTLVAESDRTAASILTAAARLDGKHPQVPAEVAEEAEALLQKFLGNELESKVLGFYTWSEELARIFRRDRML